MAAPTNYPSWVYNPSQPPVIVLNLAAFNALPPPGVWGTVPFASSTVGVPSDPGFPDTDTRLQQSLIEQRITNLLLSNGLNSVDELSALRAEVLAVDSGLAS